MGKRLAAAGMAAAIGIGGLTVAAVNPLAGAGAQGDPAPAAAPAADPKADRTGPLQRALDALVADGTLTEAQAAKVKAKVTAEAKEGRAERKAKRTERRADTLAVVAEALGSTPDEVKAGLKDGTSIAAQAEAKGVDRKVVDDALTKAITERIDAAVADGKLTEEQATKAKGRIDEAVDRILDADGHRLRDRAGRRGGN
jgi:polyhydroxyalkanoate synthesis regulator phasin